MLVVQPVAQLMVTANISALLGLVDNTTGVYVDGKISPLELTVQVMWSALDPGTLASAVQGLVSVLVNDAVLPIVDKMLAQGVRIGSSFLNVFPLSNMFLSYGAGYISIGLDLSMPTDQQEAIDAYHAFTTLE
jgi:hypothetical protein